MRILQIVLMCLLTLTANAQDLPIGSYNPEEDQTAYNNSGLERALLKFSEPIQEFFTKLNPDGYVDGPFTNFFTFLASVFALIVLHLFYAKVLFKRKRYGKDVNKLLYRYKVVTISLAVIMTIILLKSSFIWGAALLIACLALVPSLNGLMRGHMCPYCCSYTKINTKEERLGIYSNEIYSTQNHDSQYLQADQITKDSLPYGGYEIYHVEKVCCICRCEDCDNEWKYEKWDRIKKL